jgi:hypothetical protein
MDTVPIEIKVGVNGKRQANLFDPGCERLPKRSVIPRAKN